MPSPVVRVIPNPKVGVPHGLSIDLDGDTIVSYLWSTRTTPNGPSSNIATATSSTYTPTEAQAGKYLGCAVTFSSAGEVENDNQKSELLILKHSAASTGPRFRITRSSNAPARLTSAERARQAKTT